MSPAGDSIMSVRRVELVDEPEETGETLDIGINDDAAPIELSAD